MSTKKLQSYDEQPPLFLAAEHITTPGFSLAA